SDLAKNYVVGFDNNGLGGVDVWDTGRILDSAVTADLTADQWTSCTPMTGVVVGRDLLIDTEHVRVSGVSGGRFSARFTAPHAARAPTRARFHHVVRITEDAIATAISQDFAGLNDVVLVAAGATSPMIACATGS